jgi:hypothetical protein
VDIGWKGWLPEYRSTILIPEYIYSSLEILVIEKKKKKNGYGRLEAMMNNLDLACNITSFHLSSLIVCPRCQQATLAKPTNGGVLAGRILEPLYSTMVLFLLPKRDRLSDLLLVFVELRTISFLSLLLNSQHGMNFFSIALFLILPPKYVVTKKKVKIPILFLFKKINKR